MKKPKPFSSFFFTSSLPFHSPAIHARREVIDGFLHLPVLSSKQSPFSHFLPKDPAFFTLPHSVAIFGRRAVAAMTDDGMAEIWNDLRVARSRNENLRRVCERVVAEASALGERFGSVHGALRVSYEESREKERALAEMSPSIEERERIFGLLRGKKEEVLAKLEGRIKWCEEECARKESELARVSGELKVKEIELKSLRMSCEESFEEYGRKRAEVEELWGRAAEAATRVQSEEEQLKALEGFVEKRKKEEMEWVTGEFAAKQEQLGSVKRLLAVQSRELEVKSQRMGQVRSTLGQTEMELVMKNEQLSMVRRTLNDKTRELQLNNKKVDALAIMLEWASKDLEVKKEELS